MNDERSTTSSDDDSISVALAKHRTGMSFQRTRLASERTLMAMIRTSLSLIGFGFTIFQFFDKLVKMGVIDKGSHEPRNMGIALTSLGIMLLVLGIVYQAQFMLGLRKTRGEMTSAGFIYGQSRFPPSLTLITAVILLVVGLVAIWGMLFSHSGAQ